MASQLSGAALIDASSLGIKGHIHHHEWEAIFCGGNDGKRFVLVGGVAFTKIEPAHGTIAVMTREGPGPGVEAGLATAPHLPELLLCPFGPPEIEGRLRQTFEFGIG